MTTAAIYARVSSERQREEHTISSQTQALRAFAVESGLEVPEEWVFEDEGYSGATLVRPALERLRDLACQVQLDVVLCYSPDRLARRYAYQALLIEEFARQGTEIRFVNRPRAETPEDELLLQFQGMIAEYERALMAERTRRGKAHRARAGSVNVLGGAPYGYRYVRKTEDSEARYEIVEHRAEIVREIFRRYAAGEMTIGALTRWLTEQQIPTATGKTRWDRATVWGMLRNPAYHGRACFQKTARSEHRPRSSRRLRLAGGSAPGQGSRPRPPEEWIEIPVPPIVSAEAFELAARRLEDNKRFAARRTIEPTLLQGMLVCQSCGYSYYRTSTKTSAQRFEHGRVCQSKPIRQDHLDPVIWEHVAALLASPELIRQELDRRLDDLRAGDPTRRQKARLEFERHKTAAAITRLVEAYQEGLVSLDELRARTPELRRREAALRSDLNTLDAQLVDRDTWLKLAETLESFLARLRESIDAASIPDRQRVMRAVVKEVLVGPERVVIRHCIPTPKPDPTRSCLLSGRRHLPAAGQHCAASARRAMGVRRLRCRCAREVCR